MEGIMYWKQTMSINISKDPKKKFTFIGKHGGTVEGDSLAEVLQKKHEADTKSPEPKVNYQANTK